MSKVSVPAEIVENKIFIIRQQKVIIDRDIAEAFLVLKQNT